MNNMDYKPNSHKFREEQESNVEKKKVEKVIKGTAKTKSNELRKFADVFISEDVKNVKSYVLMEVLVPTIKKAIVDIVTDGINMIFFGGTGARKTRTNASYVSYNSYSDRKDTRTYESDRPKTAFSYDDIVIDNRGDAEEVLDQMQALIETYGMASIGDLYDLVGKNDDNYMKHRYGWTKMNFHNAKVERVRDGYLLKLPKALPIDK